ncbi:beta-ketoacyl synthase N-terminal-like domain-containing protein [Myxococcus eversor]|uniref:beta-ketoacyl synthase N-terminal-like domain-containing protein n=1 Tax=Myxococcus eversor TaxID=2709661 RepID=UPI0013D0CD93|nr:beta-ketoacyl synthase N-terminal-like domain-containing protein [Myxococcus eversor]
MSQGNQGLATSIAVTSMGICTPLGLSAAATHAALRARLVSFWLTSSQGNSTDPIRVSSLTLLQEDLPRFERMAAMSDWALEDLKLPVSLGGGTRTALALVLPEGRDGPGVQVEEFVARWLNELRKRLPAARGPVRVFQQGRSGFFFAMEHAASLLSRRECQEVIIGAVDSLCAPEMLRHLQREGRVLRPDGNDTIPGEGAAVVLLERRPSREEKASEVLGWVRGAVTAQEPHYFLQEAPNSGQALSSVFRQLRERCPERAELLYTCETGETFWVAELSMAYLRNIPLMPEPFVRTLAASSFGDLGAAAGGVMLGMGLLSLARLRHPAPGAPPHLLVYGSADHGQVGGCLMQAGPMSRRFTELS